MRGAIQRVASWLPEYVGRPILIAGFFVLVALLWTFLLQQVIAYPFVFLFFGAIMGSAWFGGFWAGIWAIVFSSVLVDFFFMPPLYSIALSREARTFQEAFVACAIAITAISAARRRAENVSRAAREEQEKRVEERTAQLVRSNQEILERERELRTLAEAIPQQIWRADAEGRIEYCNRDLLEYTGRNAAEMKGEAFAEIFHRIDQPVFRQAWKAARRSGHGFEVQLRVCNAQGSYRWFLVRGIPQHTTDGAVGCWYGVHIDIEEQYRADEALRVAQDDSARWSRTLSMAEMAASIAHELKQPLTALVAQAQACRRWLRAEPMNAERATNAAENLVRECTRASSVIDRVRSLFTQKEPLREAVDVNALVREATYMLRDDAVRRGVTVELQLAEGALPIAADPVQVRQLLINLANNAMDAMAECAGERCLTLRTAASGAGVLLSVLDTGQGLSEEAAARLFDPFFTTKLHGMGIGLSICRSIAEAHDGRIWAERLSSGTAFHVILGARQ
ncbi:MAG: ATP-binding protein [Terracidiphilus sp.]|nr:ATP-binding protein [Terracidiphilus sp.]